MALFDVFKKKKETARFERKQKEKVESKKGPQEEEKKTKDLKEAADFVAPVKKSKPEGYAAKVLIGPHITEKSTDLGKQGTYVFKIKSLANKVMVKQAIKEAYGVRPKKVNISFSPAKTRFIRGKHGTKSGFKKAMVYLKKGDKIEI
ncbi:MAG TPA: 50S ribosomal protein L23 [bacterium]|nr:50S ribosomal protein L23 [bacterium]